MKKPLLIGESNPYGSDPYYALYPSPNGCAGWRLCHLILGMEETHYLELFDRTNICAGKWSMREARKQAREIIEAPDAPRVVLCGSKVSAAFDVPFVPFEISEGGTVLVLPHPSGLCRLWSEAGMFSKARDAIKKFAPELRGFIGSLPNA